MNAAAAGLPPLDELVQLDQLLRDGGSHLSCRTLCEVSSAGRTFPVQAITLGNMKAAHSTTQSRPLRVPGASSEPAPVLVLAQGQRPDGSAVNGWAAYFTKGSQVVQVVMYASAIEPVAAEIFFASIKFD